MAVSFVTVIDTELASFDQPAYKQGLATYVGVTAQNVHLLVSQASVRVDARITPTETLTNVAIVQRLAQIQDAASATAQLKTPITLVMAPEVVLALSSPSIPPASPPPPLPPSSSPSPTTVAPLSADPSTLAIGDGDELTGGIGSGLAPTDAVLISGVGLLGLGAVGLVAFMLRLRWRKQKQQRTRSEWQPGADILPVADMLRTNSAAKLPCHGSRSSTAEVGIVESTTTTSRGSTHNTGRRAGATLSRSSGVNVLPTLPPLEVRWHDDRSGRDWVFESMPRQHIGQLDGEALAAAQAAWRAKGQSSKRQHVDVCTLHRLQKRGAGPSNILSGIMAAPGWQAAPPGLTPARLTHATPPQTPSFGRAPPRAAYTSPRGGSVHDLERPPTGSSEEQQLPCILASSAMQGSRHVSLHQAVYPTLQQLPGISTADIDDDEGLSPDYPNEDVWGQPLDLSSYSLDPDARTRAVSLPLARARAARASSRTSSPACSSTAGEEPSSNWLAPGAMDRGCRLADVTLRDGELGSGRGSGCVRMPLHVPVKMADDLASAASQARWLEQRMLAADNSPRGSGSSAFSSTGSSPRGWRPNEEGEEAPALAQQAEWLQERERSKETSPAARRADTARL